VAAYILAIASLGVISLEAVWRHHWLRSGVEDKLSQIYDVSKIEFAVTVHIYTVRPVIRDAIFALGATH
jgi:hypothetical protein